MVGSSLRSVATKYVGVGGKVKREGDHCWRLGCEGVLLLECGCKFFDVFRVTSYVEAEVFLVLVTFTMFEDGGRAFMEGRWLKVGRGGSN